MARCTTRIAAFALAVGVLLGGCGLREHAPHVQGDFPTEAEVLCLNQKWNEALPLLRERLRVHPRDTAAHFYLGQCYLFMHPPYTTLAEGQIRTALELFKERDDGSPIPRFSETYFELRCHLDLAKIPLGQVMFMLEYGADEERIEPLLDKLERRYRDARAVDPDSPDVKGLRELIDDITPPGLRREPPSRAYTI